MKWYRLNLITINLLIFFPMSQPYNKHINPAKVALIPPKFHLQGAQEIVS